MKLLFRFLKEQNLYSCYMNNVRLNTELNDLKKSVYNRIIEMDPECYIISAFCWSDTVQGKKFWSNIDSEWGEYYYKNR